MSGTLGICSTSSDNLPHLLGITRAAVRSDKQVEIFITGEAVLFTQEPNFTELVAIANIGICEQSYFAAGFQGRQIPGLSDKDFGTQARNAELVGKCDRYLLI